MRVLVVEDDKDIAELVAHHLGRAGYATACLHSGSAVLDGLHDDPPDLLVLDLMLPGLSGLERGADDYVTKPFSPKELVAHHPFRGRAGSRDTSVAPGRLDPGG